MPVIAAAPAQGNASCKGSNLRVPCGAWNWLCFNPASQPSCKGNIKLEMLFVLLTLGSSPIEFPGTKKKNLKDSQGPLWQYKYGADTFGLIGCALLFLFVWYQVAGSIRACLAGSRGLLLPCLARWATHCVQDHSDQPQSHLERHVASPVRQEESCLWLQDAGAALPHNLGLHCAWDASGQVFAVRKSSLAVVSLQGGRTLGSFLRIS